MKGFVLVALGFLLGLVTAAAAYLYFDSHHEIYVTNRPLNVALGEHGEHVFVLPIGTILYHEAFFSEGFDQLTLYVNANDRKPFSIRTVNYVHPYWIQD